MMTNVGSLTCTAAGPRVRHIDVLSDFLKETCAETKAAHTIAMWKQSVEVPVGAGQQGVGEFQDGRGCGRHSFAGRGSSSRGGWVRAWQAVAWAVTEAAADLQQAIVESRAPS